MSLSETRQRSSVLFEDEGRRGGGALSCGGSRGRSGRRWWRAVGAAQQAAGGCWQAVEHGEVAVKPVGEGSGQLRQRWEDKRGGAALCGLGAPKQESSRQQAGQPRL